MFIALLIYRYPAYMHIILNVHWKEESNSQDEIENVI